MRNIDDVRGQIIGEVTCGALFYGGRQQGPRIYGQTEQEVIERGKARRDELVEEYGGYPLFLFPKPELWEVRIYL